MLDPLHFTLTDTTLGTTVLDQDIFKFNLNFSKGAAAGLNGLGKLELQLVDNPSFAASASVLSQTLVPWATDQGGSASLTNGVFSASGIYGNLALWSFAFSSVPGFSTYIVDATFQGASPTTFSLDMAAPVSSSSDQYAFNFSGDLVATLDVEAPEPSSLALLGIGLLGVAGTAVARRHRARPRR